MSKTAKGPRTPLPEGMAPNPRGKKAAVDPTPKPPTLSELMHSIPEGTDLFTLLIELALTAAQNPFPPNPAADWHAAIVGAAALEYGLKDAITKHLKQSITKPTLDRLFEKYPKAPLSNFADRTEMASALGLSRRCRERTFEPVRKQGL